MCFPKLCEFKCFWCIKQKAGVSTYTHTKLLLRTAMEINKVIAFYTMCVFFKINCIFNMLYVVDLIS